jgi:hypothetical protein
MKIASFLLNITSENPERLIAFYRDTLGLEPNPDIGEGAFNIGNGTVLHIDGHSETHGMTRVPQRVLIDFFVEDAGPVQAALKAKVVRSAASWR